MLTDIQFHEAISKEIEKHQLFPEFHRIVKLSPTEISARAYAELVYMMWVSYQLYPLPLKNYADIIVTSLIISYTEVTGEIKH